MVWNSALATSTRVMLVGVQVDNSRIIGEGAFGEVLKGEYCGLEMAIKRLKVVNAAVVTELIREANAMSEIRHPNVVTFYGLWKDDSNRLHLVTEWMDHGSLLSFLEDEADRILNGEPRQSTDKELLLIALDVARAMQRLEELSMFHCDLAARNVLLTRNATRLFAKVTDFGLTQAGSGGAFVYNEQVKIPIAWSAPEVLTRRKFSTAADVWSFGVLLWEIYTLGMMPYNGIFPNTQTMKDAIIKGQYVLEKPDLCPPAVYDLMLKCWKLQTNARITFRELVVALTELAK